MIGLAKRITSFVVLILELINCFNKLLKQAQSFFIQFIR